MADGIYVVLIPGPSGFDLELLDQQPTFPITAGVRVFLGNINGGDSIELTDTLHRAARVDDDNPAASAFCVKCGGNITFQGDTEPHWCHDDHPERDLTTCRHCGRRIEPDDGGAIWFHPDTMQARCDGPDEPGEGEPGHSYEDLIRTAEPNDGAHTAVPRGPGRLLRCPTTADHGHTILGCGATWIAAEPDDDRDGHYTCPFCGIWFNPDSDDNVGSQPPRGAQPIRGSLHPHPSVVEDPLPLDQVTRFRIFTEPTGDGHQWSIDGSNDEGRYTEAIWSFDTFDQAAGALREFAQAYTPHLLNPEEGA